MLTLRERQYIEEAKIQLAQVGNEPDLMFWRDIYCAGDEYLHLPQEGVSEIERAYEAKAAEIGVPA